MKKKLFTRVLAMAFSAVFAFSPVAESISAAAPARVYAEEASGNGEVVTETENLEADTKDHKKDPVFVSGTRQYTKIDGMSLASIPSDISTTTDCITLAIRGYEPKPSSSSNKANSSSMLADINAIRADKSSDLKSLSWSKKLQEAAQERAREVAIYSAQRRPNDYNKDDYRDVLSSHLSGDYSDEAEIRYIVNHNDHKYPVEYVISTLKDKKTGYSEITDKDPSHIGIGAFTPEGSSETTVVIELAYLKNSDDKNRTGSAKMLSDEGIYKYPVKSSFINKKSLALTPLSDKIPLGDYQYFIPTVKSSKGATPTLYLCDLNGVQFKVANTAIGTIETNGRFTATYQGGTEITSTYTNVNLGTITSTKSSHVSVYTPPIDLSKASIYLNGCLASVSGNINDKQCDFKDVFMEEYTGEKVTPHPIVDVRYFYGSKVVNKRLVEGDDYKLSWSNNKKANAYTNANGKTVFTGKVAKLTITALSNHYTGSKTFEFAIGKRNITVEDASVNDASVDAIKLSQDASVNLVVSDVVFNKPGKRIKKPSVQLYVDGKKVSKSAYQIAVDLDYTQIKDPMTQQTNMLYQSGMKYGRVYVFSKAGNSKGTAIQGCRSAVFRIFNSKAEFKPASKFVINTENFSTDNGAYNFNGYYVTPNVTVSYKDGGVETPLIRNKDYVVSYSGNFKAGSAKAIVKGIGEYSGTKSKAFKIAKCSEQPEIKFFDTRKDSLEKVETNTFTYTGYRINAPVRLKMIDSATGMDYELVYGKDYTVTYADNINCSTEAKCTIKGKGNYSFPAITKTFTIEQCDLGEAGLDIDISLAKNIDVDPKPVITFNGVVLKKGKDYTYGKAERVTYRDENDQLVETDMAVLDISAVEGSNFKGVVAAAYSLKSTN